MLLLRRVLHMLERPWLILSKLLHMPLLLLLLQYLHHGLHLQTAAGSSDADRVKITSHVAVSLAQGNLYTL